MPSAWAASSASAISIAREQNVGFDGRSVDPMLQRHAVQKLHGDEGLPVLLANVIDGADVGVVQSGCGLGFALEAGEGLRVVGNSFGQELQRDEAMQAHVFSLVDHPHSATAEFLHDPVMRDGLSDHWRESYVCETGKSMKAVELAVCQSSRWRNIPHTLKIPEKRRTDGASLC